MSRKLSSLWRGPYTVIDKTSPVNYRVQLVGGTKTQIVHRNRIKLCLEPPILRTSPQIRVASESEDDRNVAGYTSLSVEHQGTYSVENNLGRQEEGPDLNRRLRRNRGPPVRYGDFVTH